MKTLLRTFLPVALLAGAAARLQNGMRKPLVIELFAGTMSWSRGWIELGGRAVGFDIEHLPHHGPVPAGAELVLQNVTTLHGSQFRDADLIVASPPCQRYSYMAMPWKRAKAQAAEIRQSTAKLLELNRLFWTCFDLQAQASRAAGRHIPMVVENVKGAQPWVGRAAWHYGSFYLWGDVPALMPFSKLGVKVPGNDTFKLTGQPCGKLTDPRYPSGGVKRRKGAGGTWLHGQSVIGGACTPRSVGKRDSRKAASAMIAKIPPELSRYIASVYFPHAAHTALLG